jgi:CBS domain-containing protein
LEARAVARDFQPGSTIVHPGERAAELWIVLRGRIATEQIRSHQLVEESYPVLEAGETFPLGAVFAGVEVSVVYRALVPTRCLALAASDVIALARLSPAFFGHCRARIASLLRQARSAALIEATELTSEQQSMAAPIRDLIRAEPVTCTPDTPVREALARMGAANVGSIVITGADGGAAGIFTLQDLLHRVMLDGADPATPMARVMTAQPLTLPGDASAYDAALLMAQHKARHVPVVEEGKVVGLVSQRDLFSAQRVTLRQLPETIAAAADLPALEQAARDIRELARAMLVNGVAAERLTQFIAALNDRLAHRLIGLELVRHDLADIRICWIALGSEGRLEQTLSTDQDNGIVFSHAPGLAADVARERLLPFAQAVNHALDRCGFPLCRGGVMASNPSWCLSLAEWQRQFASWMRNPDPQALLNSTIFFDFRAVFGDAGLADALREWLLHSAHATPLFLHHLAQGALQTRPPLGFFRDFRYDSREHPHTIDLKLYGLRPYVEAARIRALQFGIAHTNTGQRLRLAGPHLHLAAGDVQALVDGFYFIQLLRLRHQQFDSDGKAAPNRIDPDRLNVLDRRMLKEALLQARSLQQALELDYPRTS